MSRTVYNQLLPKFEIVSPLDCLDAENRYHLEADNVEEDDQIDNQQSREYFKIKHNHSAAPAEITVVVVLWLWSFSP